MPALTWRVGVFEPGSIVHPPGEVPVSEPMPVAYSREEGIPLTRRLRPWLMILWTALWTLNAFRGLRFPHPFAKGFWLLDYRFGFVKRALPGALVEPWIRGKTTDEIHAFLNAIGLTLFIVSSYLTLSWVNRVLAREHATPAWWAAVLGTTIFVLSPYVASEANLCGYLDQLLVIGTVAGAALIARGRTLSAGIVAALCLLIHEMFLLFGFPVLCFALLLQRADEVRATSLRAEARAWALFLLLPIATASLIAGADLTDAYVVVTAKLYAHVESFDIADPVWLQTTFYPLQESVLDQAAVVAPKFAGWLTSDFATKVVHPNTAALLALAGCAWWVRRGAPRRARVPEVVALVAVVLSPMAIATIGWDWARFLTLSHFHGFAALMVVSSARAWEPVGSIPRPAWLAVLALTVLAIDVSLRNPIIFTAPGAGLDQVFVRRRPEEYACGRLLFPNSDFSEGTLAHWEAEGTAFRGQPSFEDTPALRGSPARPMGNWVGSYEASPVRPASQAATADDSLPRRGAGDEHKGRLLSEPFRIDGDRIVFRVGGGWDERRLFVRLLVDGKERKRATGRSVEGLATRRWDVGRYRGRQAMIEIVDAADGDWGHINAEGFCYEE